MVLEAFKTYLTLSGMDTLKNVIEADDHLMEMILAKYAEFLLVHGIKIGGIYEHWKGGQYLVTGIGRDAENWEIWQVEYAEVTNARHKGHRTVEDFLGNHPKTGKPRFKLVE